MAESVAAATGGVSESESGQTDAGAGSSTEEVREHDGHADKTRQTDRVERALGQVEKSLQALHASVTDLGERFNTHVHQPVEVRNAETHAPETGNQTPEAEVEKAEPAPAPQADKPPPAPKVRTGVGPMKHRRSRN